MNLYKSLHYHHGKEFPLKEPLRLRSVQAEQPTMALEKSKILGLVSLVGDRKCDFKAMVNVFVFE